MTFLIEIEVADLKSLIGSATNSDTPENLLSEMVCRGLRQIRVDGLIVKEIRLTNG
jgi:hypothetical protein